jgi:hypothetical protein
VRALLGLPDPATEASPARPASPGAGGTADARPRRLTVGGTVPAPSSGAAAAAPVEVISHEEAAQSDLHTSGLPSSLPGAAALAGGPAYDSSPGPARTPSPAASSGAAAPPGTQAGSRAHGRTAQLLSAPSRTGLSYTLKRPRETRATRQSIDSPAPGAAAAAARAGPPAAGQPRCLVRRLVRTLHACVRQEPSRSNAKQDISYPKRTRR